MTQSDTHQPVDASGRSLWLRPVDFASPSALAPDQQGRLRRMADEFVPILTANVLNELGLAMEFNPIWMQEMLWREAFPQPADDAVTLTFASSAGGVSYLAIDPTLVSLVAERILGVEPDPARPLRAVTTIDRALLSRLNAIFEHTLDVVWQEATGANITLERVDAHQTRSIEVEPTEAVLVLALEVRLFNTYSVIHFLMPASTVKPVAKSLSRPSLSGDEEDQRSALLVRARLGEANVDMRVQLGSVRMTAGEVSDLHPGDRIATDTSVHGAATLLVDGIPVQWGRIGRSNGRRAVRIGALGETS